MGKIYYTAGDGLWRNPTDFDVSCLDNPDGIQGALRDAALRECSDGWSRAVRISLYRSRDRNDPAVVTALVKISFEPVVEIKGYGDGEESDDA